MTETLLLNYVPDLYLKRFMLCKKAVYDVSLEANPCCDFQTITYFVYLPSHIKCWLINKHILIIITTKKNIFTYKIGQIKRLQML